MIGLAIHRCEVVTSTNDVARQLAAQGAAEGTVVVAAEQTKGRGSRGREWLSPPGANLLVSIVLRPQISQECFGELAFVAAVGVAEALRRCCGLDARLKWPNDVRIGSRKIAGILVEAAKGAAVVGVGINVNWTDLPAEISETATSVALELGRPVEIDDVLKSLLAEMDIAYGVYRAKGFGRILQDWRALQTTIGREVAVRLNGERVDGLAVDVDERGNLIVELTTGERRSIPAATMASDEVEK